jgi:hypothetical protein
MHSPKGLEFDVVYVIHAAGEGLLGRVTTASIRAGGALAVGGAGMSERRACGAPLAASILHVRDL